MSRVKRGKSHLKKRKKLLKRVKGYKWGRKKLLKLAKVATLKAGAYAYRDRRNKKREFRRLWQIQINARCREYNLSYSKFIGKLKKAKIELDRKILAEIAQNYPSIFKQVIKEVS
ncbi:MAG: 50S ribosomal protein L20 [Parcubacteria group bacterium CG_4_10_14_0_8_um_filter_35_7]|nr:MAG: 50S ribosomal protein L20 [Parcubacteria group bacterium CG23_combo_of_CG06-09_8_20_14_all_35_9]PIY78461.1 MAG: 50S ribosomal protein L20 [Parcubacteria group bacterium CG_4_10_14_0_8_um_filter_35_7]